MNLSENPIGADDPTEAEFQAISRDGFRVLLATAERLEGRDTDGASDLYWPAAAS